MKTHTTSNPATTTASFANGRFAVSRYEPAAAAAPAKRATTATSPEPRSVSLIRSTAAAGRSGAVRFPGADFPPHRTGLRALWTPTLVDRLRTPLTRYHE